jgi:3-phosphoshikimate 1-carboxyvinyltransferase
MTLDMMKLFGINTTWTNNTIEIPPQDYLSYPYIVESDWSGASYWYSFVALAEEAEVRLLGLRQKSLQGDIAIVHIMNRLGGHEHFRRRRRRAEKNPSSKRI